MKKLFALLLAVLLVAGVFVACGGNNEPAGGGTNSFGVISWEDGEIPIVLITDYGDIDDESYNQGAWEGVLQFARANDIPYDYFRPASRGSTEDNLNSISLAIDAGVQVLVTPGFLFEPAIYIAQEMYSDVHIILLDAIPTPPEGDSYIAENTVAVLFAEEQSGFLAGYAAVMDGHRELGFIGGIPVPSVIRFGTGFVEGAEFAAAELGLGAGDVNIRYTYAGSFAPSPEVQTLAASWYADGVEVIFTAAGGAGLSVFAAADASDSGLVIGVDVDQSSHSERIITSALKELRNSVADMLELFFAGEFPGGQIFMMDGTNDGVGLPQDFSRFQTFSQADYDAIFGQLAGGEIPVSTDFSSPNPLDILTNLSIVDVTWIG
ncbi:MAG: BMP family ABC transporter substrate-binding protein [Oscillospiraceae bacterium]|nr:BMP family ABC transporter substrate-binding protein [Oscillospiraceae bacterium]